ncbi:LysE family translocator [Enterococcus sp. AZ163]|uniref:LysE family translocator n=1 Tax=Enterococcus sp. AZ163 TaxID=2774638 RepID=UPI003D26943F
MTNITSLFKGLRFGMVLQLAVGPVSIMVFNTSTSKGLGNGLLVSWAAVLVDTVFIFLSFCGISSVIDKPNIRFFIKIISGLVLILFGLNSLTTLLKFSLFPDLSILSSITSTNPFLKGILLTISNPLTIIFWSSLLTKQVIENQYNKKELFLFATGCILATILFLSFIAILGNLATQFLSELIITYLNALVGLILLFFGIKLLFN